VASHAYRWDRRFFSSTRGRIVLLLRRASATVDELATALGLTDNAVRSHITALERDGLIEQTSLRPSGAKPAYVYSLAQDAETLFPKAYVAVLDQLLDVLHDQDNVDPSLADAILRETGRRLAQSRTPPPGTDRVVAGVALLEQLGGVVEVERDGDRVALRGNACPLAEVVPGHPGTCDLAAEIVGQVVGVPVTEQCDTGTPPHCRFTFEDRVV
jgi:predicted ArsR family transcriptional regulator